MTITEKFATLTTEQQEKFNALKDGAGLDAFLSDTGLELTEEEKAQALEFIESGKLPLTDEEVNAVAGGNSAYVSSWRKIAEGEGRPKHVGASGWSSIIAYHNGMKPPNTWYNANCPKCGGQESLFARDMGEMGSLNHVIWCIDVKCYVCGYLFDNCHLSLNNPGEAFIQNWGNK